jgi:hypothetical protein
MKDMVSLQETIIVWFPSEVHNNTKPKMGTTPNLYLITFSLFLKVVNWSSSYVFGNRKAKVQP